MSEPAPTVPPAGPAPMGGAINRGVAWTGAAQAVIAVTDLISMLLVLAIWVPARDYGIAMMAYSWHSLLDTAADMGVASALIQKDDADDAKLSTVFWFNVLVSGGLFLILCGVGPLYGYLLGYPVVGGMLIAYGAKLLLQNGYSIPLALLRKDLRFDEVAKIRMAAHIGESLVRPILAALGFTIWCFTLAAMFRALVFALVMQARHPFRPKRVFKPRLVESHIRFGLRSAGSGLLYQLYTNLDYTIVAAFFGPTANGIYSMAYSIILEPVRMITNVVSEVAFPTFARLRHDRRALIDQFIRFTRLNLIAVLPFLMLLFLLAPEILRLFASGKWSDGELTLAAEVLRILCVVGVLRPLGFLGPPLLDGMGYPGRTLRYMIACAVLMPAIFAGAAYAFGDDLGVRAVAWGWSIGYPLPFLLLLYLIVRTTGLPLGRYAWAAGQILVCAGIAIAIGSIALAVLPPSASAATRLATGALASLIPLIALLRFWQGLTLHGLKSSLRD